MQVSEKILEKGNGWVKLRVDPKIYPLATVYSASYVFLDRAYVYLDKEKKNKITIWLFSKDKKELLDDLGMQFYNELINYAHYFTSLRANADTLKILMQKALFSAAPSLAEEAATKEVDELICSLSKSDKVSNIPKKHATIPAKTRK
ncbi:MAG: hypothetical protein PHT53_00085 [Candidatus Omnitrophica bacterium]|nr:hypothetical protein [Candidatus Omnitrophota bacterium]